MLVFEWLFRNFKQVETVYPDEAAKRLQAAKRKIAEESNWQSTRNNYGVSEEQEQKIKESQRRLASDILVVNAPKKLDKQTKDRIVLHGKYWKEKNLKALNTHQSKPLENAKLYSVALITDDGDDMLIPRQTLVTKAFGPVDSSVSFHINKKCDIIGTMIYDGEILMQALPLAKTRFTVPGSLTVNFMDNDYGKR